MSEQLQIFEGLECTATMTSLTVEQFPVATAILQILAKNEFSRRWHIGDLFNRFTPTEIDTEADRKTKMEQLSRLIEFAEHMGIPYSLIHECQQVCKFFPLQARVSHPLTFSHHHAAYCATEDLVEAQGWLQVALDRGFSLGCIRAWIRDQKSATLVDGVEVSRKPINNFYPLDEAERWAKSSINQIQDISKTQARLIISQSETLILLIEKLRQIAFDTESQ